MRVTKKHLEERKNRLIRICYELFCEHGIDNVTLKLISERTGISHNSIYHYYGSKATLVFLTQKVLWEEIGTQIIDDSQQQLSSATTGLEEMTVLLNNFKKLYEQHHSYLLFACDYKHYLIRNKLTMSEKEYEDMHIHIIKVFKSALKRGRSDGSINTEESIENQFYAVWGIARSYLEQVVMFDEMYDAKNLWLERLNMVLFYVLKMIKK